MEMLQGEGRGAHFSSDSPLSYSQGNGERGGRNKGPQTPRLMKAAENSAGDSAVPDVGGVLPALGFSASRTPSSATEWARVSS